MSVDYEQACMSLPNHFINFAQKKAEDTAFIHQLVDFERAQSLLLLGLADALPISMPSAEGIYAMCGRNILNNGCRQNLNVHKQ